MGGTMNSTTTNSILNKKLNAASQTPFIIKPRRMNFPFTKVQQRYFFDNNLLKSAYIAALSATFQQVKVSSLLRYDYSEIK